MRKIILSCLQCSRSVVSSLYENESFCSLRCKLLGKGKEKKEEVIRKPAIALKRKFKQPGFGKSKKKSKRKRRLRHIYATPSQENKRAEAKQCRNSFYESDAWRSVRYRVLKSQGRVCALCRTSSGELHVDHIKPKSKHPELALVESNLQVLCKDCNLGKSNTDETDWR